MNSHVVRDSILGRLRPFFVALTAAAPETPAPAPETRAPGASSTTAERAAVRAARTSLRPTLDWRAIILQAAGLWLVTRVAFVILTYFAVLLAARNPSTGYLPIGPHEMLDDWKRWDTVWYANIANLGYWKPQASVFFPLYPLLIKATTLLIGQHWTLAALLVSNLGTLAAFIGLGLWAAQEERTRHASPHAIKALAAYPLALFLFAGYTEGLFLALVIFAFFFARRGDWGWTALCGFLAGLTRPTAAALIVPLAYEYGRQQGWWHRTVWTVRNWRERLRAHWRALTIGAVVVGAVPAGFALFELFLIHRFHEKAIIPRAERIFWHHTTMFPLSTAVAVVQQIFSTPPWTYWQAHQLLDLIPLLAFATIAVVAARRIPLAYTLYTAGVLYLAIASPITQGYPNLLMSTGRYMLAAAPIFLILGRWMGRYAWLDLLLTSGGFMLQGVLTLVLLTGGWLI